MNNPNIKDKLKISCGGRQHYKFNGGKRYWKGYDQRYCKLFNEYLKDRVRAYFYWHCVVCGKSQIQEGRALCVHHVNYDKDPSCKKPNSFLVPVCDSCHQSIHQNKTLKPIYEHYLRKLIIEDYGGKFCYTDGEFMQLYGSIYDDSS